MSRMTTDEALRWANRAIERCTTDADVYAALLAEMRRLREIVQEVAELPDSVCAFWACPGPDPEPVPMATCHTCSLIHAARGALAVIA